MRSFILGCLGGATCPWPGKPKALALWRRVGDGDVDLDDGRADAAPMHPGETSNAETRIRSAVDFQLHGPMSSGNA